MDYMIWFVVARVALFIIDVLVGVANIGSGTQKSQSLIPVFNDQQLGLGGIPKSAKILPPFLIYQSGDELLLFDTNPADVLQHNGLYVTVHRDDNRYRWKMIYAGELSDYDGHADLR